MDLQYSNLDQKRQNRQLRLSKFVRKWSPGPYNKNKIKASFDARLGAQNKLTNLLYLDQNVLPSVL